MLESNNIAIITMLMSTSIMNIGMVFQKKGIMSLASKQEGIKAKQLSLVVKEPIWILGWALAICAMVMNCLALSHGNLSLLQPLVGFGLVVMVVFSRIVLHEYITRTTIYGVVCIILGVILLGITVQESYVFTSVEKITDLYLSTRSLLTFLTVIGFCSFLYLFLRKKEGNLKGISYAFIAGVLSVLGMSLSKGLFVVFNLDGLLIGSKYALHYFLFFLGQSVILIAFVTLQVAFSKSKAVVTMPIFHVTTVVSPFILGPLVFMEQLNWLVIPAMLFMILGIFFICLTQNPQLKTITKLNCFKNNAVLSFLNSK